MIKVVLIGDTNGVAFTKAINDCIRDKTVIDIKYTSVITNNNYVGDRALIIYEEPEPEED